MNPDNFWKEWESMASSFDEVMKFINHVHTAWGQQGGRRFAWRGQVNASWPLHSSLYRRLVWTLNAATAPDEAKLQAEEKAILADVYRWGLHWNEGSRLAVLPQLALLQHYGAPTRLIDISFNAWIGVWFAVEEKWSNGVPEHEDADGRLFAVDVTNRIINENRTRRQWAEALRRPWPRPEDTGSKDPFYEWTTSVYAWKPPPFDRRIAAQNGGFLIGGVPSTQQPNKRRMFWPKTSDARNQHWPIDEVRKCTSVAVRAHHVKPAGGSKPDDALFTLRIHANAKKDIRARLKEMFGYEHSTIYPDYSGFASFATPKLKSWKSA